MFHDRNTGYANAIRKIPDAIAAARKRVIKVATAAELQRRDDGPAPQQESVGEEGFVSIPLEIGAEQRGNQAAGKQKEDPPICHICANPYDDKVELRRAVKACPQSDLHLICFKCTLTIALEPLSDPEKPKLRCPQCRAELHGEFFRAINDDLGTLAPPSAEDGEDAVRDRLFFPPSDAVRPGEPFVW